MRFRQYALDDSSILMLLTVVVAEERQRGLGRFKNILSLFFNCLSTGFQAQARHVGGLLSERGTC